MTASTRRRSPAVTLEHAAGNVMEDSAEIQRLHDRCSDLMRELLHGVCHLRQTEFGGRRPYRFLDERNSGSGRWEMWMDRSQARAVRTAAR